MGGATLRAHRCRQSCIPVFRVYGKAWTWSTVPLSLGMDASCTSRAGMIDSVRMCTPQARVTLIGQIFGSRCIEYSKIDGVDQTV